MIVVDYEEVRGMNTATVSARYVTVLQLHLAWLVVVFQNAGIVLEIVDGMVFGAMAFELDGGAHFYAGITSLDGIPAVGMSSRRGVADSCNEGDGSL